MPRGLGDDPLSRAKKGNGADLATGSENFVSAFPPNGPLIQETEARAVAAADLHIRYNDIFFQRRVEESTKLEVELISSPQQLSPPSEVSSANEAVRPAAIVETTSPPEAAVASAEQVDLVSPAGQEVVQSGQQIQIEPQKTHGFFKRLFGRFGK